MSPRLRKSLLCSLFLFSALLTLSQSQNEDFLECYDGAGVPLRCEPAARSFTFGRPPQVNSTCGDPPESFCEVTSSLGQFSNTCGFVCNASDPANAHPPSLVTDFYPQTTPTWWQSRNGIFSPDTVVLNFTLGALVQVQAIVFQFQSLKPHSFYILKSTDNGQTYQPYHYFSRNCISRYMISNQVDLTVDNETEVLCQNIVNPAPGQISFIPTVDRPSANDSVPGLSDALYQFITATDITVVLDGHAIQDGLDNSSYHYAIRDINVIGKCACNGHASDCRSNSALACICEHNTTGSNCERCKDTHNDVPWEITNGDGPFECQACQCNGHAGQCVFDQQLYMESGQTSGGRCINCSDNTTGPHCDSCTQLYYPQPGVPMNNTNYCQSCSCNLPGVTNNGDCARQTEGNLTVGSCYCKSNVMGRACDTCKPGYFNLQDINPNGCEVCSCNETLSVMAECSSDGECQCKPNVIGIKCDQCADGYYLPDSATDCSPCNCNLGGSLSPICDQATGQCPCRDGVTGKTCSQTLPGYYFPFIDHKIFEAENSAGSFDISYKTQEDSQLFTGRGHAQINNNADLINFGVFEPQVSGTYDIVLRYDLLNAMMWEQIELRIDIGGEETGPASNCSEYTDSSPLFYQNLTMGTAQTVSVSLCLRVGRSYNMTLVGFESGDSTERAEIFIDSLVVFLQQAPELVTLSDTQIGMQYSSCLNQFKSIATRTTALNSCEMVSFSVFTEVYNGTRLCDCHSQGAINASCQQYGGECHCRPNVIGRACDMCEAGTYDLSSMGCRECQCNSNGSIMEFCNIIGECPCLPGVGDRDCSSCDLGFFDFVSGVGCSECGCSLPGSMSPQCNSTGHCPCNNGVDGDKCTQCLPERYNYPDCRECFCNEAGSTSLQCDQVGQCQCKQSTEGSSCSQCKNGTFNLQTINPNGCQQCFCSGQGNSCTSADGFIFSETVTNFVSDLAGWTLVGANSFENDPFNEGVVITSDNVTFLEAPEDFMGDKITSYNQLITLTIAASGDPISLSDGYDVLIGGSELELVANFSSNLSSAQLLNMTVQLHESAGWVDRETDNPATMNDIQRVLVNLNLLQIRVSFSSMVMVSRVALGGAVPSTDPNTQQAGWVENCTCHANYTGLSCQQCADGYYRDSASNLCILCECNGLSPTCDELTGVCNECSDNTTGDSCERCSDGFIGDPPASISCQPCPCPGTSSSGQFSSTCMMNEGGPIICTDCAEGHIGDRCEACGIGYFGDPTGTASGTPSRCSNCSCNGNVDFDNPNSCDNVTGLCRNCLFNTTGDQCEDCLDGYFGDPITAKNCTDCDCSELGAVTLQCSSTGQCVCRSNVAGLKCDRCASNAFNFSSGEGCEPCDCHAGGSADAQCHLQTGICTCKTGVTGSKCDECEPGYYDLDQDGCKICGCSEIGATNQDCADDGSCTCRSGVMGDKCDRCQENYFLHQSSGNCSACGECYFDLQEEVDSTRERIEQTRLVVDQIVDQNDPNTTFQEKRNTIYDILNPLNESIADLASRYDDLVQQSSDILSDVNQLQSSNLTQLQELITDAENAASPVVGLSLAAQEVMLRIVMNLYASMEALDSIQNNILPEVQNHTNTITNNAMSANASWTSLAAHVAILENELEQIMNISSTVANLSSMAWTTAQNLAAVFTNNTEALVELKTMEEYHQQTVSQLKMMLRSLNITITEQQAELLMIKAKVPTTPNEDDIMDLQQQSNAYSQQIMSISEEVDMQRTILLSALDILRSQEEDFLAARMQLTKLTITVTNLTLMVNTGIQDALSANSSAYACLSQGITILSLLQNYNESITLLRMEANEAIQAASIANSISDMIEDRVDNITWQLEGANQTIGQAMQQSISANNFSQYLLMVASQLQNDTFMLLSTAHGINSSTTMNAYRILNIQSQINSTLLELESLEMTTEDVSMYVEEVENLPSRVRNLTLEAMQLVDELRRQYYSTMRPDVDAINSIEAYIETVSQRIASSSINSTITMLENRLVELENMFNTLQEEYNSIAREVNELRQLETMLPPDCDSNY